MSNIIDLDQTGFMRDRSTDVNLRRLYTNIYASHLNIESRVIASLHIEKAFDTLKWSFLWEVQNGLSNGIYKMVESLL